MIEKAGIYVILVGGGLAWAGDRFSIPWLGSTAVLLLGLQVLAWGVELALKGEVTFIHEKEQRPCGCIGHRIEIGGTKIQIGIGSRDGKLLPKGILHRVD